MLVQVVHVLVVVVATVVFVTGAKTDVGVKDTTSSSFPIVYLGGVVYSCSLSNEDRCCHLVVTLQLAILVFHLPVLPLCHDCANY